MSERQNISSGTKWEESVGYSRAVRIGPHVWVAGTTAVDGTGAVVGENDPHAQAAFIFSKIGRALELAGATSADVVRTRMYVTRAESEEAVGRAHSEALGHVRPAATMLRISGLVDERLLVEIEIDAYVQA